MFQQTDRKILSAQIKLAFLETDFMKQNNQKHILYFSELYHVYNHLINLVVCTRGCTCGGVYVPCIYR